MRLQQGYLALPSGVTIKDLLRRDGMPPTEAKRTSNVSPKSLALAELCDRYLRTHRDAVEDSTLETSRLHFKHLCSLLGERFPIRELKLADLQS
jgi:hypothetical protein